MRFVLVVLAAAGVVAGVSGCAGQKHKITTELVACCETDRSGIRSFEVVAEDMPGFLVPFFRDELIAVLRGKGLEGSVADADARVVLSYRQIDLDKPLPPRDPLGEHQDVEIPHRFVARVVFEMRDQNGNLVWSGHLSRLHGVMMGQYMHERSRAEIRRGFEALFEEW